MHDFIKSLIFKSFQIHLLDSYQTKIVSATPMNKNEVLKLKLTVTEYAAKALSILFKNEDNRGVASTVNIISMCQFWIRSKYQNVTIPILILLQHLSYSVSPSFFYVYYQINTFFYLF